MVRRLPQRQASLAKLPNRSKMRLFACIVLLAVFGATSWILLPFDQIKEAPTEIYHVSEAQTKEQQSSINFYEVTKVIDGDTFEIRIPEYGVDRIRFKDIDTPEIRKAKCTKERELAYEATNFAKSYLEGQSVRLVTDPRRDRYGRTLAHVFLKDGRDLGKLLLGSGLAVPWPNEHDWCR